MKRDSKFGVLEVLYKPDAPGDRFEDMAHMIEMCGRAIGCSTDGKRTFHVLDGRLYVVWPGVDISSMDYFEFCQALRERPPAGRVLDFVPHCSFHLGRPTDRPADECLMDPETARRMPPAAQEAQISGKWVLAVGGGGFVRGFNNMRAELETAADARGAMKFDTEAAAERYKRNYAIGYAARAVPEAAAR